MARRRRTPAARPIHGSDGAALPGGICGGAIFDIRCAARDAAAITCAACRAEIAHAIVRAFGAFDRTPTHPDQYIHRESREEQ